MTCRSVLVPLDRTPSCAARVGYALALAKALNCHAVGLAVTHPADLSVLPATAPTLSESAARVWDALRDQAERVAGTFRDACHGAAVESFEAIVEEGPRVDLVLQHARCCDLALLTQADPSRPDFHATKDLIESVVLHSARPTLVLPHAGRFDAPAERVLVAWDDSREAARAVSDALPLLQRAQRVEVVSWNETRAEPDTALHARLDALLRWLKWHGVEARARVEPAGAGIADAILSRAADTGAGLVVMGAYGHARVSEWVLGGATRDLLRSMTVPVLMSH